MKNNRPAPAPYRVYENTVYQAMLDAVLFDAINHGIAIAMAPEGVQKNEWIKNEPKAVAEALARGANPNGLARGGLGMLGVHAVAVMCANPETLTAIVSGGADINARDGLGNTALHYLADGKGYLHTDTQRAALIKTALKLGADLTLTNKYGATPLDCADPQESAITAALTTSRPAQQQRGNATAATKLLTRICNAHARKRIKVEKEAAAAFARVKAKSPAATCPKTKPAGGAHL